MKLGRDWYSYGAKPQAARHRMPHRFPSDYRYIHTCITLVCLSGVFEEVGMKRLLALLLLCLVCSAAAAETITVAAAISLKDALTAAAKQYKTDTGEDVEFTFAASGQLASQIQNGAPVDLFISAAN